MAALTELKNKDNYCLLSCNTYVAPEDPDQVIVDGHRYHGHCWRKRIQEISLRPGPPPESQPVQFYSKRR